MAPDDESGCRVRDGPWATKWGATPGHVRLRVRDRGMWDGGGGEQPDVREALAIGLGRGVPGSLSRWMPELVWAILRGLSYDVARRHWANQQLGKVYAQHRGGHGWPAVDYKEDSAKTGVFLILEVKIKVRDVGAGGKMREVLSYGEVYKPYPDRITPDRYAYGRSWPMRSTGVPMNTSGPHEPTRVDRVPEEE